MPTFRATEKTVIPSRTKRFARFLEQFITPTPSREKASLVLNLFLNPGIERKGALGVLNEFFNPRIRRYGFWKVLHQFLHPEPPRSGAIGKVITSFFDAPVYRLQQGGDVIRPRQKDATFLQKFISGINEFVNAYTHFSDLFPDIVIETPSDAFKNALEKVVFSSRLRIERMTEQLFEGQITPRQYHARMIDEIEKTNVAAALLGIRGIGNLTPDAIRAIRRRVLMEVGRLNRFIVDSFGPNFTRPLDEAKISENQFRAYANRFASAGRASSTIAQAEVMRSLYGAGSALGGSMFMRRVMVGDDRSCASCVSYASVGWVRVSSGITLPPPGVDCECESNCRCLLEYCMSNLPGECPDDYG